VSKDVRISGYFSNAKSVRDQKCLGNVMVEKGSAKSGSAAWRGRRRIRRSGRII
jgi:hypothetical protein